MVNSILNLNAHWLSDEKLASMGSERLQSKEKESKKDSKKVVLAWNIIDDLLEKVHNVSTKPLKDELKDLWY